MRTIGIPAIAAKSPDSKMIFAGIARGTDGQPDYELWLLTAEPDSELSWNDAVKWAAELGDEAALPTRREQALLYAQLPEHFESDWYWSGTQYAGNDAYAWDQYFDNGYQTNDRKLTKLRVRAVRRLPLQ